MGQACLNHIILNRRKATVSNHIERPVHQIVDKISDSLDRLEKQLELLGKIINREPGNQEEVDEPPR